MSIIIKSDMATPYLTSIPSDYTTAVERRSMAELVNNANNN